MMKKRLILFFIFLIVSFLQFNKVFAGVEPFENFIKGNLKIGDSLCVKDEKFKNNNFNWNSLNHLSVKNYVSLKILDDQPIQQDFEVKFKLKIVYYSTPNQIVPTTISSIDLNVNYTSGPGKVYQLNDVYEFVGAHDVKVFIEEISSPQFGSQLPISMQLTSGIVVNRLYPFEPYTPIPFSGTFSTSSGQGQILQRGSLNNQVKLNISIPVTWGADEYDVEWTPIDKPSEYSSDIENNSITTAQLEELFKNNATRVTLKQQQEYSISLVYNCQWIAVRVRGVNYNNEGVRVEGVWSYEDMANGGFAIWDQINWHESNLNWQYSVTYAEEGKRKEVISYFDGSLRNRQTVTLLNKDLSQSEPIPIVQENIYDEYGKPVVNVLPAPIKELGLAHLKYFKGLNKNVLDKSYSFEDLNLDNCTPFPSIMNTAAGTSNYYSSNNNFLSSETFNKYLPDAQGYPFSVNLYTPDNTGRLAKQGGVGPTFQPGTTIDRTTKYYYGRPEQWELDAIFGNDAGYASRYQKNMVIDPNGQGSISYLNSAGKTVATALTGNSPDNLTALNSASNIRDQTINLIRPDDFKFEVSALKLSATTTYISSVISSGNSILKYDIGQLISRYPNVFDPCSNCFYNLKISVKDDCGVEKNTSINSQIIIGSALSNPQLVGQATGTLALNLDKIGTYFITIELTLDENVIGDYTDSFVNQGLINGFLDKKEKFINLELKNLETYFLSCFTGCDALTKLGSKEDFRTMFKQKMAELGEGPFLVNNNTTIYDNLIDGTPSEIGLYQKIYNAAEFQVNACKSTALSTCDAKKKLLLEDVSPNGQYALFDENGNAQEIETNVLSLYYKNVFSGTPNSDDDIILENGNKISPYDDDFSLDKLVKYWKPEWAEKFLIFHPEHCKLQFCEDNIASENWDTQIRAQDNAPNATNTLTGNIIFDQSLIVADWLVNQDPFFKSGGLGFDYAPLMSSDLNEYSKNVLKKDPNIAIGSFYPTLKNLLQINLIQLYCSVEGNTTNQSLDLNIWDNCSPSLVCRSFDREWQMYRSSYLDLKQKYIDLVRKTKRCQNACDIGTPIAVPVAPEVCQEIVSLNSTAQKINQGTYTQFTEIDPTLGYRFYYNLIPGNSSQLPTVGLCEFSPIDYAFYPCIIIRHPGNPTGEQFNNVWKVNCVKEEVECTSIGEIFTDQHSINQPNVFYVNYGSSQSPTWEQYTIYESYDINNPPVVNCSPNSYASPVFYRCFYVYYNNQVISYNNVFVASCPAQDYNPSWSGRSILETSALNEKTSLNSTNNTEILNKYSVSSKGLNLDLRLQKVYSKVANSNEQVYIDIFKNAIYKIVKLDKNNAPKKDSLFSDFTFKDFLLLNPSKNFFVRLKNVWIAELLPDSGSIKYKENKIVEQAIANARSKKLNSVSLQGRSLLNSTNYSSLTIGGACVSILDEILEVYDVFCGARNYQNVIRRTTAVLLDQYGQLTTQNSDVTLRVFYEAIPGAYGGGYNGSHYRYIVIPAGQSTGYYDYLNEEWVDWYSFSHCVPERYEYRCVDEVIGANFCENQLNCDGVPGVSSCHSSLSSKISHFPLLSQPDVSTIDFETYKSRNENEIGDLIKNAAKGHADNWVSVLIPAIESSSVDDNLLRLKLQELTELAVAPELRDGKGNPLFINGLSSVPQPLQVTVNNVVCRSYGEILKAVFGKTHYTENINPWLLEGPVPYPTVVNGKFVNKMQVVPITITNTNQEIADKLESLKPYPNITPSAFYSYLQNTFGNTMTLTLQELEILMKACGECKFILPKDITLPVFLEPGAKGFITKAEYDQAFLDMNASFELPPNENWENFETIVANFMNHRFGFALSYNQYKQFETDNTSNPTAKLSNQPPYISVEIDKYDCVKNIIATAFYTAEPLYQAYLLEEKKKFRTAYISTCSVAKANFNLETKQNIYHYTLYYFDQASNLIRTVPPEGVSLLSNAQQIQVQKYREFGGAVCEYQGPTTSSLSTTALQQMSNTINGIGNKALEFWLYKTDGGDRQLLASTPDHKYMLQICITGQRLNVDIYTLNQQDPNSISFIHSNHIQAQIGSVIGIPWVHLVLQGSDLATGNLQLFVNGQQQVVQVNDTPGGCVWEVGGATPIEMPQNHTVLKHLRHYNRLMDASEILANAQSGCFMPSGQYLAWDRFNVPNLGDPTTINANSTVETQYKEGVFPNHGLITSYAYNSTNQVVAQQTPDAGLSNFWYDYLNRLVFSQNAKQVLNQDYSYTEHDNLGRVTEVGQLKNLTNLVNTQYLDQNTIDTYIAAGNKTEITQTIYDDKPVSNYPGFIGDLSQHNLRKRVIASIYRENPNTTNINASYYSYDLSGNVKTIYQQIAGLYNVNESGSIKKLDYEYDLLSGKINFLAYQHGYNDAFYYKYDYDAENRLINAWTSISANIDAKGFGSTMSNPNMRLDASYQYYQHGVLARVELGDMARKVQGIDYAYTLQGWLKGVNGTSGQAIRDMGLDGHSGTNHASTAKDAFGFALHYYGFEDYKPIGMGIKPFSDAQSASSGFAKLYNGNIGGISLDNPSLGPPQLYTYKYDQLNRLLKTFTYNGLNLNTNTWNISANQSFREEYTYDANGNIEKLTRKGNTAVGPELMDKFTYGYNKVGGKLTNNRLRHIKDIVPAGNYTTDIDDQNDDNYTYDAIGNLIEDQQEGIEVDWSIYGKIKQITKASGNITYAYDAGGNRVGKITSPTGGGQERTTYYVRDAQGNTLAVYDREGTNPLHWREQQLYGNSRLGMWKPNLNLATGNAQQVWDETGNKFFELSNHLGNVMAVISDKLVPEGAGFKAELLIANDYYAFGSIMPGRSYNVLNLDYRYGFNGKENDNEIKGDGNQQDYGMRIYDPRIARFLSVDPKAAKMPSWSPYSFSFNNPIYFIDPDGQEPTPAEAARMAAHVYGDKKDNILTGGWRVSQRDFGVQLPDATGLKSLVYERVVNGKVTEYTYATAGTENLQDWKENGKQPLGLSKQYESSANNAKKISGDLGETELSYVGHSLGGGQAALNSLVTDGDGVGRKAFTFNAAGVGDITKFVEGTWKTPFKSESKIDAYILRTDPLNKLQNSSPIMPDVNGNRHYLWPKDLPSVYNGHSIDNIIKNFGVNPDEHKK